MNWVGCVSALMWCSPAVFCLQEEQRDLAQIIRVSGSILLSTVSNFLDFVKLEAGRQLEIVLAEINLAELLADLHSIIQAMIGRSSEVDLKMPRMIDVPEVGPTIVRNRNCIILVCGIGFLSGNDQL